MAQVIFKDLSKKFDDVTAVDSIDLQVEDKKFVVLVGPSGCGKTTALRMLAGLEDPTGGEIYIGDNLVNGVAPKDRDIAMVFQNYALYPHKSVYQNMAFGLMLRRTPKNEIDQRVRQAAQTLGIEKLLDRRPKQLSGGQKQRVALGRAIVRQPKVFLFDEPLSNLDAKLRVEMRAELSKLHQKLEATIIYVTHDQVEAMTLGDKVVVMKEGRIQQIGAPLDIYNHPYNKFVASFIGSPSMNFFKGKLVKEGSDIWVNLEKFRMKLPEKDSLVYKKCLEKGVILGIRPEDISDRPVTDADSGEVFEKTMARVNVFEALGPEVILELSLGDKMFRACVKSDTTARVNQEIPLYFNTAKVHLFDGATEESLFQIR